MRHVILVLVTTILLLALASCGDDDTTSSPTQIGPSNTAKPTAIPAFTFTPTPQPTPATRVPPGSLADYRLAILRPTPNSTGGQLYIADYDGSNAYPVTDYVGTATLAGMPSADSLYYIEWPIAEFGSTRPATLMHLNITTGERQEILPFESQLTDSPAAAVSPDERYVAFINGDSLDLYDRETAETRRLLQGNIPACNIPVAPATPVPGPCFAYRSPVWSPDGLRIAIQKGFYEGAVAAVVDVANPVEQIVGDDEMTNANNFEWSPDATSLCVQGQYGGTSALYVASASDWQVTEFLGELEDPANTDGLTVQDCGWNTNDEIRVAIGSFAGVAGATITAVTRSAGDIAELASIPRPEFLHQSDPILQVSDDFVLVNLYTQIGLMSRIRGAWVDLNTGEVYPLPIEGAVVAAVLK